MNPDDIGNTCSTWLLHRLEKAAPKYDPGHGHEVKVQGGYHSGRKLGDVMTTHPGFVHFVAASSRNPDLRSAAQEVILSNHVDEADHQAAAQHELLNQKIADAKAAATKAAADKAKVAKPDQDWRNTTALSDPKAAKNDEMSGALRSLDRHAHSGAVGFVLQGLRQMRDKNTKPGEGFSATDARLGQGLAERADHYHLSPNQLALAHQLVTKYHGQMERSAVPIPSKQELDEQLRDYAPQHKLYGKHFRELRGRKLLLAREAGSDLAKEDVGRAIYRCRFCGNVFTRQTNDPSAHVECQQCHATIPGKKITGKVSNKPCGPECLTAQKTTFCSCSCGGKNHGRGLETKLWQSAYWVVAAAASRQLRGAARCLTC